MNLRSWKSLKSIAVLLLVMEFLTPAILTGMLPADLSGGYQPSRLHLDWFKQKNPSSQLAEALEESRPETRDHELAPLQLLKAHTFLSCIHSIRESVVLVCPAIGKQFATHPPLFTLNRLLLV